jgi:hypothetical protein
MLLWRNDEVIKTNQGEKAAERDARFGNPSRLTSTHAMGEQRALRLMTF